MLRCFSWASAAWQAAKRELKLSLGRLLTVEFPPLVRKLSLFQAACICLQAGMAQAAQSIPFVFCVFLFPGNSLYPWCSFLLVSHSHACQAASFQADQSHVQIHAALPCRLNQIKSADQWRMQIHAALPCI